MRKLVIFHYIILSWPLFSHPEHTTFLPLASSPLASSPLADLNPLAESNLPSTRRIKDNSFQKSLFPLSRALRPFTSISALKKQTKIIQPKYDFRTVVLDLTQAELGRQEEGVFSIWPRWFGTNATHDFMGSIDSLTTKGPTSETLISRILQLFFYLPTQHTLFTLTYSFWFMTVYLVASPHSVQTSLAHVFPRLRQSYHIYYYFMIYFMKHSSQAFGSFSIYKFATANISYYYQLPESTQPDASKIYEYFQNL